MKGFLNEAARIHSLVNDDTQELCVINSFPQIIVEPTAFDWKKTGFAEGQLERRNGAKCSPR